MVRGAGCGGSTEPTYAEPEKSALQCAKRPSLTLGQRSPENSTLSAKQAITPSSSSNACDTGTSRWRRPQWLTTKLLWLSRRTSTDHRTTIMGTNTSSPAAYVDSNAGVSGIARMGGAQPRKTPSSTASQNTAPHADRPTLSTAPRQEALIRSSVDTLPPYQPAENRPTSGG